MMLGTGVSLLGASVPSIPTMLSPSLWLDDGHGVTETGSVLTSWTCKVTGKTAVPSPMGFAVENGKIKSGFGTGMQFPATQAQTICILMQVDDFPTQVPNAGTISAVMGDSSSIDNDDYIFLSNSGSYEISIDGRVGRTGIYQRGRLPALTGANVGSGSYPINSVQSLIIRYQTVPNPWEIFGAMRVNAPPVFGSQTTWHQVMLFERMLGDVEVDQLMNWMSYKSSEPLAV